ncbi:hypothetical protein K474DRAFT_1575951, partial [Panus rudis PR-1116 ss-1]
TSTYTLDLPEDLRRRRIHPTFHISKLRLHVPNDDELFPGRTIHALYDFGQPDDIEYIVDEIVTHEWQNNGTVEFYVRWADGDCTWETYDNLAEVQKLDEYFELQGVSDWREL